MPTTVTTYTPEQQAEQVAKYRALADLIRVGKLDTPYGQFEIRRSPDGYHLSGEGRRLFGILDEFAADTPLTALDDADALTTAKEKILARAEIELAELRRAFGVAEPLPVLAGLDDDSTQDTLPAVDAAADLIAQEGL